MEDNLNVFEALYEKAIDYAKTTIELNKLKAIEKAVDLVSSIIPHTLVFVFITFFVLSLNLGVAFWIGDILGKVAYGFFIVAGFYCITGVFIHFFFHESLKRLFGNYFLKQIFK